MSTSYPGFYRSISFFYFFFFFLRWRPAGWKYNSVSEEWLQKGYSRLMRKTLIDPHNEIDEEGPKSY